LKNFGFTKPIAKIEEKTIEINCEMVWWMAIAQRKIVMQSIHPPIGNVFYSIYFLFSFTFFLYTCRFLVECNVSTLIYKYKMLIFSLKYQEMDSHI